MYDVAVIGCGITGAATAYALSRYTAKVIVLEAGNDVANGTTKANSAILHAGYDPAPGTLMARLNVAGVRMAKTLCEKLDVQRREIGSLVVAFSPAEMHTVQMLCERGRQNGVEKLAVLDAAALRKLEPNISPESLGALYAPTAAIVDPWDFCLALIETAVRNGVTLRRSSPVTAIEKTPEGFLLATPQGNVSARFVVNAAGLAAQAVHELAGGSGFTIRPSRGEYYLFDKKQHDAVRQVVFQCPSAAGKGVLVAPTVHGNLLAGPNAEDVNDAGDVANTASGLAFVRERALRSVPSLDFRDSIRNFAGVRAASDRDDFIIGESAQVPGFFNLAGIKSPGLSAAPAIGEECVSLLADAGLALHEKPDFIDTRTRLRFRELPPDEQRRLIESDPAYGNVICRCETITEAEILSALRSPVPPCSIDGVKRRCGAGMGRCQGGFCAPRVHVLLARALGVSPLDIPMDETGSWLLSGETKEGA